MKIVLLHDNFPSHGFGGAAVSTEGIAIGMKKAGHEVFVITTCRKESEAGEADYCGIKTFKIASNYPDRWRWYVCLYNRPVARQVEELLKKIRPDVVHANNIHQYLSFYCLKLAKRYAEAVVFTARDVATFNFAKLTTGRYLEHFDYHTTWRDHVAQAGKRYNPLRNFFIRWYLGYADKITAISEALKKALIQNGIGGNGIEVIYNGIDASEWNADEKAGTRFRTKHGLLDKKVLLFGGRLSEAKGAEKTIEALAQIIKEVPTTALLVMGNLDWYAQTMKEKAKRLGMEKQLVFTGWIEGEEIKAAYAAADVVLMPSICFDSFGRVNIEAMAAGKPVVGTCYGGTPEIVVDGVTGYIVNPLYPEQIAAKTLDLLRNPAKAEQFGQAGYERVIAEFNLGDKVVQYLAWYRKLLDKAS